MSKFQNFIKRRNQDFLGLRKDYYFVDFALSVRYNSLEERKLVKWEGGHFEELYGLEEDRMALYDPFKADVLNMGLILLELVDVSRHRSNKNYKR